MIDLGANVQAASDMARFHHAQVPNVLTLETPLFELVGSALGAMGHNVHPADGSSMGGFQAILVQNPPKEGPGSKEQRVYRGGSDHRKDGQAVGW